MTLPISEANRVDVGRGSHLPTPSKSQRFGFVVVALLLLSVCCHGTCDLDPSWDLRAEMPNPNYRMILGYDPSHDPNTVVIIGGQQYPRRRLSYDISLNQFTLLSDMSADVKDVSQGYTTLNNVIYFTTTAGGFYFYDMTNLHGNNDYVEISGKPFRTWSECVIADKLNQRIYVLGGYDGQSRNYFQIYNVSTDTWEQGPPLREPLNGAACQISYETMKVYVFGGSGGSGKVDSIQSIDLDYSSSSWQYETATLSSKRSSFTAVSIDEADSIYLLGGTASSPQSVVQIFHPQTGLIETVSNMLTGRSQFVGVAMAATPYRWVLMAFGGQNQNNANLKTSEAANIECPCEHFDTQGKCEQIPGCIWSVNQCTLNSLCDANSLSWNYKADMPEPKNQMILGYDANLDDNTIVIFGGVNEPRSRLSYDIALNQFTRLSDMSGDVNDAHQGYTSLNNVLYFTTTLQGFYSYDMTDVNGNNYVSISGKPEEINSECVTADKQYNRIYLLGGYSNHDTRTWDIFQIYDLNTQTWAVGPSLRDVLQGAACEISYDTMKLYVFGGSTGITGGQNRVNRIESIDLDYSGKTWRYESALLSSKRSSLTAVSIDAVKTIYLLGGAESTYVGLNPVDIFHPVSGMIESGAPMLEPRILFVATAFEESPNAWVLMAFGGSDDSNTAQKTTEATRIECKSQAPTLSPSTPPTPPEGCNRETQSECEETEGCRWSVETEHCTCASTVPTDVVFALDSSGSVGSTHFQVALEWTAEVIASELPSDARVSLIRFSDYSDVLLTLSDSETYSQQELVDFTLNIPYKSGETDTVAALEDSISQFDLYSSDDKNKVLILVTDGNPNAPDDDNDVCRFESELRSRDIETIIIGVGNQWDRSQVECLVTSDEYIIEVEEYTIDQVDDILSGVTSVTCPVCPEGGQTLELCEGSWSDSYTCDDRYIYGCDASNNGRSFTRSSQDGICCFRGAWGKDDTDYVGMRMSTIYDTAVVTFKCRVWLLGDVDVSTGEGVSVLVNGVQVDFLQRNAVCRDPWFAVPYYGNSWMAQEPSIGQEASCTDSDRRACYREYSYSATVVRGTSLDIALDGVMNEDFTVQAWGVSDITVTVTEVQMI